MGKIGRIDRLIGVCLLAAMLALLGLALSRRTSTAHAASASAVRAGPATPLPSVGTPVPTTTAGAVAATGTTAAPSTTVPPTTGVASPATSAASATTVAPSPVTPVAGPVSAVGDSIMLDIQSDLEADVPGARVDGLVSRQFEAGIGIVQADRVAGTLGNVLVVELGTNGTVTSSDFDAMMAAASGVARVVFVNVNVPRSWMASDNAVLAAGVARYPGVAVLADWNSLSSTHPEWFTADQVHLEPAGAAALANLIAQYA
jgi:hypothetical protein